MKNQTSDPNFRKYLKFAGAPFLLIVAPIFGFFIGLWLDRFFLTTPILSYMGLTLGIIAGIREFYRLVKEIGKDDQSKP